MRLPNLQRYSFPSTVAEASAILADPARKAVPLSGGVSFVFSPGRGVEELVCLRRLPLSGVRSDKSGLRVGATTLIAELAESGFARKYAGGLLALAAAGIGSTLNRNLITVGGNLVQPFIWSDLPAAALALDARFRLRGEKSRRLSADTFYRRLPSDQLLPGELLVEVIFPAFKRGDRSGWRRFSQAASEFALLKAAVVRRAGRWRIVAGGAAVFPQRLSRAERIMGRGPITPALIARAAEAAAEELKAFRDIRCSSDYKRLLCRDLVSGILHEFRAGRKGRKA